MISNLLNKPPEQSGGFLIYKNDIASIEFQYGFHIEVS